MKLYEGKEEVEFNLRRAKIINSGLYGKVYQIAPDTCIKIFNRADENCNPLVFDAIREINSPNFYEVYHFFTSKPLSSLIKAYTMKYYSKEQLDILTTLSSYTLDNLNSLYSAFMSLTASNISIQDTHTNNTIYQKDKIIIIDTDLYFFNNFQSFDHLTFSNMKALSFLFASLYLRDLEQNHQLSFEDMDIYRDIIYDLFTLRTKFDIARTTSILSNYKYPIDYFRKVRKR